MAVTMIAAILLAIGGVKLASTKSTRSRGILMGTLDVRIPAGAKNWLYG